MDQRHAGFAPATVAGVIPHARARRATVFTLFVVFAATLAMPAADAPAQCEGQGNATLVLKTKCDIGERLKFKLGGRPNAKFKLVSDIGAGPTELPGVGVFCLDFSSNRNTIMADRFGARGIKGKVSSIPDDPSLVGETMAFQAGVIDPDAPNGVAITNAMQFVLCPAGTGGDACVPCEVEGEPCSCGIEKVGWISPVFYEAEFPATASVRLAPADMPETTLTEVTFQVDPDDPPALPILSSDGLLTITKVTFHMGVVVIFAEAVAGEEEGGAFPPVTLFEAFVGEEKLNREITTDCTEPLGPGFKFRPLFITEVVPFDCPTVDCPLALDFETEDDFATILVNGQDVSTPPEFGTYVAIEGTGNNQGAACFDSNPEGPNADGPDPDLLVGLGNVLILQSNNDPEQTEPGIFDTPNDSAAGGTLTFDFVFPSELSSIDLIDLCEGNQDAVVTLTDSKGRQRIYDVPGGWTTDIAADGPPGFGTLDLTTLDDQPGFMTTATATEDPGFDAATVFQLTVWFESSGATDNLVFCPAE